MKALILVGGFGTRLRPLTLSVPKPVVPFANKPMVVHQLEALQRVGVTEVILAVNYKPETMQQLLKPVDMIPSFLFGPQGQYEESLGVKIYYSKEDKPLGTAGPIALARERLLDGTDEPFFVLNSDVTCSYPLAEMLDQHKRKQAEATLCTTPVEDPSQYGVIVMDESNKVHDFMEKPKKFVGDKINAGIYLLQPSVVRRIPEEPTSIEKDIFPRIAKDGRMFGYVMEGYWMDIGQPKDFLEGQRYYLNTAAASSPSELANGANISGNVVIDRTAKVDETAKIGPSVSIGADCNIAAGARLKNCVVMDGTSVEQCACVTDSILGWHSRVGQWSRLLDTCVLGEDVTVKDECVLSGAVVLPNKEIKDNVLQPRILM